MPEFGGPLEVTECIEDGPWDEAGDPEVLSGTHGMNLVVVTYCRIVAIPNILWVIHWWQNTYKKEG